MIYRKILFITLLSILMQLTYAQPISPDLSFGNNGQTFVEIGGYDAGYRVITANDGSIYTMSIGFDFVTEEEYYSICKFNKNGQQDIQFATDGVYKFSIDKLGYPSEMKLLSNGKLVLSSFEIDNQVTMIILEPDGSTYKKINIPIEIFEDIEEVYGFSLSVTENSIFIGGLFSHENPTMEVSEDYSFILKTDLEGVLHTDFANGGIFIFKKDGFHTGMVDFIVNDSFIIGLSYTYDHNYNEESPVIYKINHNGDLDLEFGDQGIIEIPIEIYEFGDMFFQGDNILINIPENITSLRITPEGYMDMTYANGEGLAVYPNTDPEYYALFSILDPYGASRFLVGDGDIDFFERTGIVGFTSDGLLENSFGENGLFLLDSLGSYYYLNGIYDDEGRLLLTGIKQGASVGSLVLARFHTELSPVKEIPLDPKAWTVFPNPITNDMIHVYIKDQSIQADMVKLYDLYGRQMATHHPNHAGNFKLDLIGHQLTPAMYLIELFENGQSLGVKKVVVR